jgi:hypothetical protein
MQVINRDNFTMLPMPPSVIEYLNGIAENQKRKISTFYFVYEIQRYIEDDDVNIQDNNDNEDVIDQLVD